MKNLFTSIKNTLFNRSNKVKSLIVSRPAIRYSDFEVEMEKKGYEREVVRVSHDSIKNLLPHRKTITLYPTDDLAIDYRLMPEEIEEILETICDSLQLEEPNIDEQLAYYEKYGSDITVESVIHYFSLLKNQQ